MEKRFWTAVATLSGTVIGAGFLGIPYVVSKSGLYIGLVWMILLCGILMLINLMFGQIVLSSNALHQIVGYSSKYLGKKTKWIALLASVIGFYAAFLAYLIGEGESLSFLFFGNSNFILWFGLGFFVLMGFLTYGGIKKFKKIEPLAVLSIIFVTIILGIINFTSINLSNFSYINFSNFYVPFGVILFAFLGVSSIPEMRRILGNDKKGRKMMKKAIIIGSLIPLFIYVIFTFIVLGLYGQEVSEVATISFGAIVTLLGIFAMFSAYLALSLELQDTFKFDLYMKKKNAWLLTTMIPLVLFLIVVIFNLAGFAKILSLGGAISGGLLVALILLIHEKVKKQKKGSKILSEFKVDIPFFVKILLILFFLMGIIFEFI